VPTSDITGASVHTMAPFFVDLLDSTTP